VEKIILDLCGGSGAWSKPYKDAGYDVRLITLPKHDVLKWRQYPEITEPLEAGLVHGILAAPPCTVFSRANWRASKAQREFRDGMETVRACLEIIWEAQYRGAPLAFWALENPQGYLYNFLGRPPFWFQPWMFGERGFLATKRTAIWGYFNRPTKTVRKRTIPYVKEKQNRKWYGASPAVRAVTPAGFARAFFEANP
jgi:hypothetical protein